MTKISVSMSTSVVYTFKGHLYAKVNGYTVGSNSRISCSSGSLVKNISNQPEQIVLEGLFTVNHFGSCSAPWLNLQATILTDGGSVLVTKTLNVTANGNYKIRISYNSRSKPNGAPTYLEELHKLDRKSQSHYIPR